MKGFSCAALVALLFAAALAQSSRPGPQVIDFEPYTPPEEYAFSCQAPAEGLWHFQNNFRLAGPGSDYGPVALSEMTLIRQGDTNIYNATGLVDTANGRFIDVPVSLVAVYNPATCYLTGTAFAPSTATTDSFAYWSTGTTLYGPYVVAQNATLLSPLLGITNATIVAGL